MQLTDATARKIIADVRTKSGMFFERVRRKRALEVFHAAAARVPAYRDFLKKNKINAAKVKTFSDFALVPPVNKENYLYAYPLEARVWGGTLARPMVFTATSGSTGEQVYFPRERELDWESSIAHELFLQAGSHSKKNPTLVLVGFSTGVWIAGLLTYKAFEIAATRGQYPLSILTTGINKQEILNAMRKLSPHFTQTILIGYPPFIKDIIDEAAVAEIDITKLNLRLIFAAEAFSEGFRDHLTAKAGVKNVYRDTMNIYGTADIGTMAYETPAAILMRQLAVKNEALFHHMFTPIKKTPTLTQYNPYFICFEETQGELLVTGNNTVPLIRYELGDNGGIFSFNEAQEKLSSHRVNLATEARKRGIGNLLYKLPFVFVYERKDFSTTIYGLQIYPEMLREAFLHPELTHHLTGKFTLETKFDPNQDQYLEIHLELQKGRVVDIVLQEKVLEQIMQSMLSKSSEFRELHKFLGERARPKLTFWPAEHPDHFKPGIKQRWVKKG